MGTKLLLLLVGI